MSKKDEFNSSRISTGKAPNQTEAVSQHKQAAQGKFPPITGPKTKP